MDNSPRRMHAPLERQRSENNHIRDGRWPLRIGALTAAVALILVLMFNFMAPKGRLDAPSATGATGTTSPSPSPATQPVSPPAPSAAPQQADPATTPAPTSTPAR
ncbi:hypothetical protein IAE26_26755 [Delftia sp. S67]|uniref:hypothetical protein n=2 Tax=Delftia TaxID=80865 RepID=UPI0018FFAF67|nr:MULTISPECIES: hypothetical protein [unclassified Delftia]MBK0116026.1 hypothetical protein [Delftia sp. S65]MBK0121451.1 hypothetical protein [Delftia sp. S67]MBK0133787.1 hypothetical protein [Delftia sp. S66]